MSQTDLKKKASVDEVLKRSQQVPERPLDPTRDAEDILGEGRAGVTSGDPRQISAEPDEVREDTSVLPGGDIKNPTHLNPTGFTRDQLSDEEYDLQTLSGMSQEKQAFSNELASEGETRAEKKGEVIHDGPVDNLDEDFAGEISDSVDSESFSSLTPHKKNDNIDLNDSGEEDPLGGTAPDPEKDGGDVGDWMKRAGGEDPDRNMDNPQPVSDALGDKRDQDEQDILES